MLQYNILNCDRGLCKLGLYCGICIAIQLMYCKLQETRLCRNTKLYCDRKARQLGWALG